jgi:hypothetical protein
MSGVLNFTVGNLYRMTPGRKANCLTPSYQLRYNRF